MATATLPIADTGQFIKFLQFSKIEDSKDGKSQPTVWGVATWEKPDSDNECCDYDSAVAAYKTWSEKSAQRTKRAGQSISLGNIRLQHGSDVGGKVTKIDYDDDAKEIWVGSEPKDDTIRDELRNGYYTGYSQGGSYAWRECMKCEGQMPMQQGYNFCETCNKNVPVRYGLKRIAEVSYVDSPATGEGFEHVKANGSTEILKFKKRESVTMKTKLVAGEQLPPENFAHVGDIEKTESWKLPIKFEDAVKTKRHIHSAMARIDQTKGMSDEERTAARTKIEAAAKAIGLTPDAAKSAKMLDAMKSYISTVALAKGVTIEKSMYDVARCAEVLMGLKNLWECSVWELEIEGDGSEVPDQLRELLDGFTDTFIAMATEEARELAASNKNTKGDTTMTPEELQKQQDAEKAAKKSLASHFAKAASHHDRMADKHEKMGSLHEKAAGAMEECMGKATAAADAKKAAKATADAAKIAAGEEVEKADTDADDSTGHIDDHIGSAVTFHKAAAKVENGLAAMHGKHAEHMQSMAEGYDEESAKATKATLDAEYRVEKDAADKPEEKKTLSLDDEVAKAAAIQRETPEYKAAIADIAKKRNQATLDAAQAMVDAEVEKLRDKTVAPTGLRFATSTKPGEAGIVLRDTDTSTEKLATRSSPTTVVGM